MKYRLTGTTKTVNEITLHRIEALVNFGNVKQGDLGGWIESESNLSQTGNAWVSGNASVFNNAHVYDNAHVSGNAQISGNSHVYDNARIYDSAWVYGNAQASGNTQVSGNSHIYDNAWVAGNTRVYENTQVSGSASIFNNVHVYGNAWVAGNASVFNNARVAGNAQINASYDLMIFCNVGSENGVLTAYRTKDGIGVTRGCFTGSLAEFEAAVKQRHGDNQYGKEYAMLVEVIKFKLLQ